MSLVRYLLIVSSVFVPVAVACNKPLSEEAKALESLTQPASCKDDTKATVEAIHAALTAFRSTQECQQGRMKNPPCSEQVDKLLSLRDRETLCTSSHALFRNATGH